MSETGRLLRLWQDRTEWRSRAGVPLRAFVRSEAMSAGLLVLGVVAALIWVNAAPGSYRELWSTTVSIRVGAHGLDLTVHEWVNDGLMTLFFLVVGLEARREFDLGDLRERRRSLLPVLCGVAGMAVPAGIYLAINAGGPGAHGWAVGMSTDTALALGSLTLLGRRVPERARIFLLTVLVVDDLVSLLVIGIFYSHQVSAGWLLIAAGVFAAYLLIRRHGVTRGPVFFAVGVAMWFAMLRSGVDPVIAGLAIGLSAPAYTPARGRLESVTRFVRSFREQPTAGLAHSAVIQLGAALSPNSRLQYFYRDWAGYLIVPLFALANAGIVLNGHVLGRAFTSSITLGMLVAYLVGKPLAVAGGAWVVRPLSRGRLRAPLGRGALLGTGTAAGAGFTVALLIARRAFTGAELEDVTIGALTAVLGSAVLTWAVYAMVGRLPLPARIRALYGDVGQIVDLVEPVDAERDHIRGPDTATVTIVEYGDFECPYCGQAEPVLREVVATENVRYVWRHLPLPDVHPHARLAAEASEAAAAQDAFWPMHDRLLTRQDQLDVEDLLEFAAELGLDPDRFRVDLAEHVHVSRVDRDIESADFSGVSGTPTFFINGSRHHGAYDLPSLTAAVKSAHVQQKVQQ